MKFLDERTRYSHVFRDGEKIEPRPAQHAERISNLIEKPSGRDGNSKAERSANQIENMMMPRSRRIDAQFKIAAERFDLLRPERLQLVHIQRHWKRRYRDSRTRLVGRYFDSLRRGRIFQSRFSLL